MKLALLIVVIALGFWGDIAPAFAQDVGSPPKLTIELVDPQNARLTWPRTEGSFHLEEAAPFAAFPFWNPVPQAPQIQDGQFSVTLSLAGDGRFFRLLQPTVTFLRATSPAHGEVGVSVTRESILRFSGPLAADTVLTLSQFYARFGDRRLLARIELARDRQTATLFYLEDLPGGARLRVFFDGNNVKDISGRAIDADGDGQPGGIGSIEFETFSTTAVPGTAVVGRVFASELVPGSDTGVNAMNRPLAGVTITVDGREEMLRAVTDAQGNFKLEPVPAGRFFVHIDGRTAPASQWPNGDYYPVVGKAWEAVAGRSDNLAGGSGEIFLPLIKAGTLQPVHTQRDTVITFPPEVIGANPALAGVALSMPANDLFSDNGARGGRVGIAPVPPNRLPGPLPDGLNFPLVITVQTDGPGNFDTPVPVCFPNLPDPITGQILPPGAKSALWSFNHDTGDWEIVGPMTVTPDGRLICSDPGVGIRQPGWHGTQPGAAGSGGDIEEEEDECSILIVGPIGGEKQRELTFITSIPASSGGSWSWSAPAGTPASGGGRVFQTRFAAEGTFAISVNYVSDDGEETCSDVHGVVIRPQSCTVGIVAPVDVPPGVMQTFTANVSHPGGTFAWSAPQASFPGGSEPSFQTRWSFPGEYTVALTYTRMTEEGVTETCTDEVTVFVGSDLRILRFDDTEVPDGAEIQVGEQITVHSNQSSSGTHAWSANDAAPGASISYSYTFHFTSPGRKAVTLTFDPYNDILPTQTRLVTFQVKDRCHLEVTPLAAQVDLDTTVTFQVTGDPTGGTFSWSAAGGTPASGTGSSFTTKFATPGLKPIDVTYHALNGETCLQQAFAYAGTPDCDAQITGPSVAAAGEVLEFSAVGNHPGGFYSAKVAETGESLGFANKTDNTPFEFATQLPGPGTYTIKVFYSATVDSLGHTECTVSRTVTVPGGSAALRIGPVVAASTQATPPRTPHRGVHYLMRVNLRTGQVTRELAGSGTVAHPRPTRLESHTRYHEFLLAADTFKIARVEFTTPGEGESFTFPKYVLRRDSGPDTDGDGLTDLAEMILGSNPSVADTDGDGVRDDEEAHQGSNPLGSVPEPLGLVAAVATPGYAVDVSADGSLLALALREAGVAVFNVLNGLNPVLVAQIDTPGEARAVACSGNRVLVADGETGVAIIDLDPAGAPPGHRQISLGSRSTCVAAGAHLGFVGLANGEIVVLDLASGAELSRLAIGRELQDLVLAGDFLYLLTEGVLHVVDVTAGDFRLGTAVGNPGSVGAAKRRLRLVAGGGLLYAVHTRGFNVFSLENPVLPRLIQEHNTAQIGWKHLAPNGSGSALAAVDANSTDDGPHDVSLFDLNPDGTNGLFVATFETPGLAEAVAINNGLGYVADGRSGLEVVRYLASDSKHVPPTIALRSRFTAGRAEENKLATFAAVVSDDVQVRSVDFFVDDVRVATDGNFPFEFRFLTPKRTATKTSFRIRARAIDTGGNVAESAPLTLELASDATPPRVLLASPTPDSFVALGPVRTVTATLDEPVRPETLTSRFVLFGAGPDGQPGTGDDVPVSGGVFEYRADIHTLVLNFSPGLAEGAYRAVVKAGVTDLVGNARTEDFGWNFHVPGLRVLSTLPDDGDSLFVDQVTATFNNSLDPASLTASGFTVFERGPDGSFGTADDVIRGGPLSYDQDRRQLQINLQPSPPPGRYRATIRTSVRDVVGNALRRDYTWDFEIRAIRVSNTHPQSFEALPRGTVSVIEVRFDGRVDPATLHSGTFQVFGDGEDGVIETGDDVLVAGGQISYSAETQVARMVFPSPLLSGQYRAIVRAEVADTSGAGLGADFVWRFSVLAPMVADLVPAAGRAQAPGTVRELKVTFAQPMNPGLFEAATFQLFSAGVDGLRGTADDELVNGGGIRYDAAVLSAFLTLAEALPPARYRAVLNRRLADTVGNQLGQDLNWDFSVRDLTVFWVNPGKFGGSWFDPASWSSGEVPSGNDHVVINQPGEYLVDLSAPNGAFPTPEVASLTIGGGAALPTLSLDIPLELHVREGVTNAAGATLVVGGRFGTRRIVTPVFENLGRVSVSLSSLGEALELSAAPGQTLLFHNAGQVQVQGGRMTLSRALVSHSGQFLTADASLLVFQDESLLDYTGLGTFDGTSGTVGFSFSTLRLSAELTHGAGRTLDLSSARLEGPATLVNLGTLKMGNPGTLNTSVRNQGTAELDFGAALNAAFDNLGSLKLGGRLTLDPVNGQMINHGTVTLAQRSASARVIATGGQFRNEPGSIFRGANTFDAANSVVTFEGSVEPGGSASFVGGINPGTLALTGPLPLTETSRVLIEIAGRGDFADRIAASGPATLSGALEIRLLNNFKPNLGDRFTIVSSNARTGEFSTVAGLAIDATRRFEVRYSASEVTLEVVAAP